MMSILLLILALLGPVHSNLTATWEENKARLVWKSGATQVCIDRLPASGGRVFLGCYGGQGSLILPGDGPNDYAYFPKSGDVYCLDTEQERVCAPLLWRVRMPIVVQGEI